MLKRITLLVTLLATLSPLQAVKIFSEEIQTKIKNAKGPEEIKEIIKGSNKVKIWPYVGITSYNTRNCPCIIDSEGLTFDKGTTYKALCMDKNSSLNELNQFFSLNPSIKSLALSIGCWESYDLSLVSNNISTLDYGLTALEIKLDEKNIPLDFSHICEALLKNKTIKKLILPPHFFNEQTALSSRGLPPRKDGRSRSSTLGQSRSNNGNGF